VLPPVVIIEVGSMILLMVLFVFQTGVEAGRARVSCDGSAVTLQARPVSPPANYLIEWEDGVGPGVFQVTSPLVTTSYRVFLTDLETGTIYEDSTTVLVHPFSSDLTLDGLYDREDWLVYFDAWGQTPSIPELDPNDDGTVNLLDWFYFCNFDVDPPNTPPSLTVWDAYTNAGEMVEVEYNMVDLEQEPELVIDVDPQQGAVTFNSGVLRYFPGPGFTGTDSFQVYATDGLIQTPNVTVFVEVLPLESWGDLFNDIFLVYCNACHIEATSGGLSLGTYAATSSGGNSGAGFVAGSPENSPIYLQVNNGSMPLGMPPLDFLEIERIRLWILRGALP